MKEVDGRNMVKFLVSEFALFASVKRVERRKKSEIGRVN